MLYRQACSRRSFIWLVLLNGVVLCAAVATYLFWPAARQPVPAAAKSSEVRSSLAAGRVTDLASVPVPAVAPAPAPAVSAVVPAPVEPASAPAVVVPPTLAASASASASLPLVAAPAPVPASPASEVAPEPVKKPVKDTRKDAVKVAPVQDRVASKPKAAVAVAVAASPPHFAINVGVFAKETNAQKVRTQLLLAKLPVYTQELQTSKGKITRVRVGPYKNQKAADAAAEKIHALKLDAVVFQQ